jgi:hypothetical protein
VLLGGFRGMEWFVVPLSQVGMNGMTDGDGQRMTKE